MSTLDNRIDKHRYYYTANRVPSALTTMSLLLSLKDYIVTKPNVDKETDGRIDPVNPRM